MKENVESHQVWSSVLGSSLKKVLTDGTQWKTRFFAGGALIAKNNGIENKVERIISDPETGTTVTTYEIKRRLTLLRNLHGLDEFAVPDDLHAWFGAEADRALHRARRTRDAGLMVSVASRRLSLAVGEARAKPTDRLNE